MPPQTPAAELEIGLHRLDAFRYSVELRFRRSDNDADMAPFRGPTAFDFDKIRLAEWDGAEAIAKTLTDRLFANPSDLADYQMAPVKVEEERKRAKDGLGEIPIVEVIGPDTYTHVIDQIREEFDILYVVAHGALRDGEPILWLEDATGASNRQSGRDLVDRLGELPRQPRLPGMTQGYLVR